MHIHCPSRPSREHPTVSCPRGCCTRWYDHPRLVEEVRAEAARRLLARDGGPAEADLSSGAAPGGLGVARPAVWMVPDAGGVMRVSADRVNEGGFRCGWSLRLGPGEFVDGVVEANRSKWEVWELVVVVEGYGERAESFVGGLLARGMMVATQEVGGGWVVRARDLTAADRVGQHRAGGVGVRG